MAERDYLRENDTQKSLNDWNETMRKKNLHNHRTRCVRKVESKLLLEDCFFFT